MDTTEFKALLDKQGEAFESFKAALAELKKKTDVITEEKMAKIEKSLDSAVELKAAIERGLAAEKKEREELEARINREGIKANSESEAKAKLEVKDFNIVLSGHNASRNIPFSALDTKGYTDYKSALERYHRYGKDVLTSEEVKTLSVGSDPNGGYFVTPDTTGRIVTKNYEMSPFRQIASEQTISTDKLQGIEDLGEAGCDYADELTEGSNTDTPDIGKWEILVYWLATQPKTTQQLLDDSAVDIESWLGNKVALKFARKESLEFVAGAKGKIRGFTSYDTAPDDGSGVTWGKLGYCLSGKASDFADANPGDKIHDLIGLLQNAYLPNARFVTRRKVITKIRKFKIGTGEGLWQPSFTLGTPEMIAGYPVTRIEDMPDLGAGSMSLAFGDFKTSYQIVDRQGIRVLRDMYTLKPYIKFYTTKRTGGGVLNFEAIKLMKFAAA